MASWNGECYADNISDDRAQEVKSNNEVVVNTSVDSAKDYYDMSHQKRGTAVILNHQYFAIPNLETRLGTKLDRDKLQKVLKNLGFKVQVHNDLTYEGVMKVVKKVAESDHSKSDAFVMAVLTHGKQNTLYANDQPYRSVNLWNSFTEDKCPTLSGKPKIFFIQACQGLQLDPGVILSRTSVEENPLVPPNTCVASMDFEFFAEPDFFIAFSTVPGYYSFRSKKKGSWFIQVLCTELKRCGRTLDLHKLLTMVSQKVAIQYESYCPQRPLFHNKKQISYVMTTLTKLLIFVIPGFWILIFSNSILHLNRLQCTVAMQCQMDVDCRQIKSEISQTLSLPGNLEEYVFLSNNVAYFETERNGTVRCLQIYLGTLSGQHNQGRALYQESDYSYLKFKYLKVLNFLKCLGHLKYQQSYLQQLWP